MCADNGICEDAMNQGCDEFCGNFAARGMCGSKRCDDERDCDRYAGCQTVDESGQPNGFFDCSRRFTCNQEAGACDTSYATLSDTEMCQQSQLCVFDTTVD
ncbi:MAG: hypothetical protein GY822_31365 [Deltaproteobacteria bacterium]|nr:hypothetical protein [Deltaproteobacteria bacterium]